jgi:predicted enzyme related to lactoylglutathione lyase
MTAFVHHELNTSNPDAARKFYKDLFGWKFQDMKMPNGDVYAMFTTDAAGKEGGGIQKHPMPGQPSAWLQYVGVASVKKAMAKAVKLGATSIVEYQPVPGHGALGVFADPTGAACAVWEPDLKAQAAREAAAKPAKKPAAKAKKAAKKPAKKR